MIRHPVCIVSILTTELFYPFIFILYYLFCCCLCTKRNDLETPQESMIRKFKKWLDFKRNSKNALNYLMRLYARVPNAVAKLEDC